MASARSYLDVPFRHHARSRTAIDCLGLPLCVAEDLELSDVRGMRFCSADHQNYRAYPTRADILKIFRERMIETSHALAGDVLIFRTPLETVLIGIRSDIGVIRADMFMAQCVVEHRLDDSWRRRIQSAFFIPEQKFACLKSL